MTKRVAGRILMLELLALSSILWLTPVEAAGPAGVEDGLQLWLSADSGARDLGGDLATNGEQVETWIDQSVVERDVTRSAGGALYSVEGLNFNPTLAFDTDRYIADDTGLPSGAADRSIFIVASANSGGWRYVLGAGSFGGAAPAGSGFDFGHSDISQKVFITTHNPQSAETGSWLPYGTARLAYGAASSTRLYIAVNGEVPVMGTDAPINTLLSGSVKIGTNSRADEFWNGNISEVIFFDRLVDDLERQRINSYLALKYGFSLDQTTPQSYLASGDNLMWDKDAADASTYDNDLFGIGRDDASNLSQIKSRGQNLTTVITVEAVNEGTNLDPDFEDIDDLEFLVFGDNGGAASWTETGAPAGYSILARQWKKQEQGDVGFVNMDFDVANSNMNIPETLDDGVYYFVYDSDNDGSLADEVPQGMTDQGGDDWRVTVDFGSGGLFTLATTEQPAAESLSPVDNAVGVNGATNLVITFSTTVTVDSGNIVIKRTSDDSTVETIDVTSEQVTGSGTDTITINPSNTLLGGIEYYVQIATTSFKDVSDNYFPGITNTTGWSFTTGDFIAPEIDEVTASTTSSSTATIMWATNENASTRVVYGLTSTYGTTTPETDTSPRVTSHEVEFSDLLACTMYHYAVVSRDASGNSATSTDQSFITAGCAADTTPTTAMSKSITSNTGGVSTATVNGKTLSVSAPANATASSSSFVIQIKAIPSEAVLTALGRPNAAPSEVGVTVFDVKAIINGSTILDSFDAEITIEYEYTDGEISDIDESTLWLYHYTGGQWIALNDCVTDTNANTISCTTPSFSIFGLFGSGLAAQSTSGGSGGSTRFGCKDPKASNYDYFSRHKQELCEYNSVSAGPISVCAPHINSYIRYGAVNDAEDVRKLEAFLNDKQGESLLVDGVYGLEDVEAVKRFQQKYASEVLGVWGLTAPTGYVYRTTLMKINSFYCNAAVTCPYFTEYNSLTENPTSTEVERTKVLMKELGFYSGVLDTTFDTTLNTSLKTFQETFAETMLRPWGLAYGTGYKYKTTNKFLNMLVGCKTPAVELDGHGRLDY